jgi:hypothetical protein
MLDVCPTPVRSVEYIYHARQCPVCRPRREDMATLGPAVRGRVRVSLGRVGLIARL